MSNIIDSIQVSGVTYTIQGSGGGTVSSAITSGDTNPVEGGVLYDELRIPSEVESGLTLEWENYDEGYTTNYPSGQSSKITIYTDVNYGDNGYYFRNSGNEDLGFIQIVFEDDTAYVYDHNNCTYTMSGNVITVEYTSIAANVDHIYSVYDNYWTTIAYISTTTMIPLIDQVSANTVSLSGKQDTLSAGTGISISGNVISATGGGDGSPTVELTQSQYDALVTAGTVSADTYYIITDAQAGDLTQYWTSAQTQSAITEATSGKVDTNTDQDISGIKTFVGEKKIKFKQSSDSNKLGFTLYSSASTNNELGAFELRPNTVTVDGVQHPLIYIGHYRANSSSSSSMPQTMVGFRQYDQYGSAAYHYLIPLPEKAKTPFSLTTSFKNYYAPIGFKNGSTMITADETGVADLSSELGGLKLVKLTQQEYDNLQNKDNNTLYVIV